MVCMLWTTKFIKLMSYCQIPFQSAHAPATLIYKTQLDLEVPLACKLHQSTVGTSGSSSLLGVMFVTIHVLGRWHFHKCLNVKESEAISSACTKAVWRPQVSGDTNRFASCCTKLLWSGDAGPWMLCSSLLCIISDALPHGCSTNLLLEPKHTLYLTLPQGRAGEQTHFNRNILF